MSRARDLADLGGSADAGGLTGRNLIINGAFQVWQRATAATAVGGSEVVNTADRWTFWESTDGAFTTEQSTDVPSGQGFAYSLKAACTSADTSLAAGQFSLIGHKIEAQNLSHLNYGTSSAKTMTLSFWVKSNKTGTYCFSIEKHDETDYILIKEFSVSSADTWEKKTLTITPDSNIKASAGAITNDNGLGLRLLWALALGTTYNSGSDDGTWTDSTLFGTTNQVNWMDSDSNEFYITGVQLEVGSTATPFEHESYDATIQKCYRYYFKLFPALSQANYLGTCYVKNSTQSRVVVDFPVPLRTKPTAIEQTGTANDYATFVAGTQTTCTAVPTYTNYGSANSQIAQFTSSGLTNGHAGDGRATDADGFLAWSAEL